MCDSIETAITSDVSGSLWTFCIWDPRAGTNLMSYKCGSAAAAHTLSFIRNEFLVCADNSKPIIHVWPINSNQELQGIRYVTPGHVTALAVSPDGNFLVAGCGETIHVWQIATGKMLAALARHYQAVTVIKFTDDGSHFVSAAQDGMILVWRLASVVQQRVNEQATPLHTFSDHALSVTDVYLGKGGIRALMCTVSADRSCKLYDLASGSLLLNLVFTDRLSCVTMDHLETNVYVGTSEGQIFEFSLQSPPRAKDYHITKENCKNKFVGHTAAVKTLSISLDGETLMSGGADDNVNLWHIQSKLLIRTLPHKGTITNASFILTPKLMFKPEVKLNLITGQLKRMIEQSAADDEPVVEVMVNQTLEDDFDIEEAMKSAGESVSGIGDSDALEKLKSEVLNLKAINKELYQFSVKHVMGGK